MVPTLMEMCTVCHTLTIILSVHIQNRNLLDDDQAVSILRWKYWTPCNVTTDSLLHRVEIEANALKTWSPLRCTEFSSLRWTLRGARKCACTITQPIIYQVAADVLLKKKTDVRHNAEVRPGRYSMGTWPETLGTTIASCALYCRMMPLPKSTVRACNDADGCCAGLRPHHKLGFLIV